VAVRRATEADAALMSKLSATSQHPTLPEENCRFVLQHPECVVLLEDEHPAVAWFRVYHDRQEVELCWLLPREAPLTAMKRLVRAGFRAVRAEHPRAASYTFFGDMAAEVVGDRDLGERAARTWKLTFEREGIPLTVEQRGAHWRGIIPSLDDAIRGSESWQ
jgi:hypothetical protein